MYNKDENEMKEKPCWFYIDSEPLTSFREVQNQLSSKDIGEKEASLKKILGSIINDENYPDNLMMSAINYLTIVEDLRVIEKKHANGKIREEFILVCNSLRKELTHPNEYVRGRVLRLLCKLPYIEILESLKSVIIENINHKHLYVRKNALLCILSITNNFGPDVLPESLVKTLREIIEKDSDLSCKRNAYLALSKIDKKESFLVTKEILTTSDINEIGDLFILSIVENLRNLCILFPKEKGKMLKILIDLSNHKSHSVLFEVANSLILLSSSPNVIKTAVGIFCNLLVEQKDNNILIIILKKLINIKNKYRDILEEQILSFAIILNSTTNSEIRKLLFDLIIELFKESNISQVFDVFINDLNKLRGTNENDSNIQFKNMIFDCMHKGLKRFPNTNSSYALFLLDRCILYDSKNTFINEQINIVKDLFYLLPNLRKEFVIKILGNFEEIQNSELLQLSIWLFAEFITNDIELIKKVYLIIMKNMGDLNLESLPENNQMKNKENQNKLNEKKVITKTVILPDGTYGTQQIILDSSEVNKQKENKFLRTFILETNFFFSTNLVIALTRLVIKMYYLDSSEKKEVYNSYFYNTINIICAVIKIKSDKIYKDPDNVDRINLCLECLINKDFEIFTDIIDESRDLYNDYYSKLIVKDANVYLSENKNRFLIKNVDDYLSFRFVKNNEVEASDLCEDDKEKVDDNNILFGDNNSNKFIEVISGKIIDSLIQQLRLKLIVPSDTDMIDEESAFLVSNLYTKTRLGEDALINISIERTKEGKIIGAAIIRSRAKEFAQILGDKIKSLTK